MGLEKSYCICDTEKTKTLQHMKGKFEHNMRLHEIRNADSSKRSQNEVLIGDENIRDIFSISMQEARKNNKEHKYTDYMDTAKQWKEKVEKATGRKVRKDAVLEFEVVLTYSKSDNNDMDLEEWKKANVEWLKEYFGEENVFSAVLHMDETTPHIHAMIVPIDRDRGEPHFNSKKWLGGYKAMVELQNQYAERMKQFGLERGEEHSRANHTDIRDFYKALNNVVRQEPPKREHYPSDYAYQAAVDEMYKNMTLSLFALEERIKRLETVDKTREHNQSIYRAIAESKISGYEEQIQVLESDLSEKEKKAKILDNIKLAIDDMAATDPNGATEIRNMLNRQIKAGDRIAQAIEKKRAEEQAKLAGKREQQ